MRETCKVMCESRPVDTGGFCTPPLNIGPHALHKENSERNIVRWHISGTLHSEYVRTTDVPLYQGYPINKIKYVCWFALATSVHLCEMIIAVGQGEPLSFSHTSSTHIYILYVYRSLHAPAASPHLAQMPNIVISVFPSYQLGSQKINNTRFAVHVPNTTILHN